MPDSQDAFSRSKFAPYLFTEFQSDVLPALPTGLLTKLHPDWAKTPPHLRLADYSKLGLKKKLAVVSAKMPGEFHVGDGWTGFKKWRTYVANEGDLEKWATWPGAGVCMNARRMAAIDGDILDEDFANWFEAMVIETLGPAPRRVGLWPKRLLPYRVDVPIAKARLSLGEHAVEILGDGQQFLVEGIHPKTGKDYEWSRDLAALGYGGLSLTSLDSLRAILAKTEAEASRRGFKQTSAQGRVKLKGEFSGRKARPGFKPDLACNVARFRKFLETRPPAIEGQGGDFHTLITAQKGLDLGCERETTCDVMAEDWNERCDPPWDEEELRQKVENAYDYRENEVGCDAIDDEPMGDAFKNEAPEPDIAGIDDDEPEEWEKAALRFIRTGIVDFKHDDESVQPRNFMEFMADKEAPPLKMLAHGWLEACSYVALVGSGGTHKSRLLQQLYLCLLYNRQWLRPKYPVPFDQRGYPISHICYLSYENSEDENARRFSAMRKYMGIKPGTEPLPQIIDGKPLTPTGDVWDMEKTGQPILIIRKNSSVQLTRFGYRLLTNLEAIPGHKVLIIDSFFNAIIFEDGAQNFIGPAMAAVQTLLHWCKVLNLTILSPFHPSRSATKGDREDAGHSPVFMDRARQLLQITAVAKTDGAYDLSVLKANHIKRGMTQRLEYEDGCIVELGSSSGGTMLVEAAKAAVDVMGQAEDDGQKILRSRDPEKLLQAGTGKNGRAGPVEQRRYGNFTAMTGITSGVEPALRKGGDIAVSRGDLKYDIHDPKNTRVKAGYRKPRADELKPEPTNPPDDTLAPENMEEAHDDDS